MPNSKVGELRIDDSIGGIANLRVIFFVGDDDKCHQNERPVIWILAVLQKKRDDFTTNNIKTYWARRQLVIQRFYDC